VGSFGGSISHLVRCQAILPVCLGRLDLLFVVWILALTFLRCWALMLLHLSSFLVRWSLYFFGYNSTCWNWHFFVPNGIMRCPNNVTLGCSLLGPTIWEPNGSILTLLISFFGISPTQEGICLASNKRSFGYYANMFLFMCGSKGRHLVISSSYHTYILFIFRPFFYSITYLPWLITSYSSSFMVLVWSYHWWYRYPFISMPLWEWMCRSPQHTSRY
jgi:hypothetical protein